MPYTSLFFERGRNKRFFKAWIWISCPSHRHSILPGVQYGL